MLKKETALITAVTSLLALIPFGVVAGSDSHELQVSATVEPACTIQTAPVAFGTYKGKGSRESSGSVTVQCVKDSSGLYITLDNGTHADGTQRRMGGNEGNFLTYELYQPSTTEPGSASVCDYKAPKRWGDTKGTDDFELPPAASEEPMVYNVCGQIAAQSSSPVPGTYSDSVLATINFE